MSYQTQKIDSFLKRLNLKYGPSELMARFFLKAVHAAADRGVFLEFGTFAQLWEVNQKNANSWFPITTSFRENPGGVSDDTGFVFLGRNHLGDVVATQSARIFDWSDTNFKREAEELRFFYADPDRDKAPNESCIISAPNATEITGRVALGGGIWYRPDFRRLQLGEIISRMGRAYAFALWNYDSLIATITQQNVGKAFDKRIGFRDVSPKSIIMRHSPTFPEGDLYLALARMTPMQLIDDTFGFLADFDTQVDVRVDQRRAQ